MFRSCNDFSQCEHSFACDPTGAIFRPAQDAVFRLCNDFSQCGHRPACDPAGTVYRLAQDDCAQVLHRLLARASTCSPAAHVGAVYRPAQDHIPPRVPELFARLISRANNLVHGNSSSPASSFRQVSARLRRACRCTSRRAGAFSRAAGGVAAWGIAPLQHGGAHTASGLSCKGAGKLNACDRFSPSTMYRC